MARVSLAINGAGEAVDVSLKRVDTGNPDSYVADVGGVTGDVQISVTGSGSGYLKFHGRLIPFYANRKNDEVFVWLAGRAYTLTIKDGVAKRTRTDGAAAFSQQLSAPMPGTILKILIDEGETFAAHETIIIMESMKMEMSLSAPHAGRVAKIECQVDQLVEMGAVLARLEGIDDDPAA